MFVYRTEEYGFLKNCKARLVVGGNQRARGALPTWASTMTITTFKALMAITAR